VALTARLTRPPEASRGPPAELAAVRRVEAALAQKAVARVGESRPAFPLARLEDAAAQADPAPTGAPLPVAASPPAPIRGPLAPAS
jgi:hypothetical protein